MSSDINFEDIFSCAVAAARAAGDYAIRNIHRRTEIAETFAHDVKLKLDSECQACAESVIRSHFPEHIILGEEDTGSEVSRRRAEAALWPTAKAESQRSGVRQKAKGRCLASNRESEFQWIIDPIDGTVNFFHGLPLWCCSIAVRYHEDIVVGVVYAPALNELYTATVHEPALCNGSPIKVSTTSVLSGSIVFTGVNKSIDPNLPRFAIFEKIASNVQRPRIFGSAALDMCYVARGYADGYFESGIYIWDVAAAGLIVRQAGGKAEILGYSEGSFGQDDSLLFLATNGYIHAELKTLVDFMQYTG